MKGGAWLVLAVSALMGLGLTIGAIASRRTSPPAPARTPDVASAVP